VVRDAIESYRSDNDWLGHFIEECCELDDTFQEKSGELYQAYRAYCSRTGEYVRSTTDFYNALDSLGVERKKDHVRCHGERNTPEH
jgi:putative DNA primase/helicase